ncbi:MAG: hypothetical protein ACKOQW_09600 [Phycisphaerales bacterium]
MRLPSLRTMLGLKPDPLRDPKLAPHDVGFHADAFLLRFVGSSMPRMRNFVETGCNVGNSIGYVARHFPDVDCFSCEPDPRPRAVAESRLPADRVWLSPLRSQEFLPELVRRKPSIVEEPTFFWLDAHGGGFRWPLIEEMQFILGNFRRFVVAVDDFLVPGRPDFGFDRYRGQECSHAYVRPHLRRGDVELHYPTYAVRTSPRHALRGWGVYSRWDGRPWDESIDFLTAADWDHAAR